jgi:hypothetical protein
VKSSLNKESVQLAPPGAGLPPFELFVSRILFFLMRQILSDDSAVTFFRCEGERILRMVRQIAPDAAAKRVLIPRLRGIEDSSRSWSVYMTLSHLIIVNEWIAEIIETISAGKCCSRPVSTAAVKPSSVTDPAIVSDFERMLASFQNRLGAMGSRHEKMKETHPWFGPLNAHGWRCLAALHQRIHRRQIEQICRCLR